MWLFDISQSLSGFIVTDLWHPWFFTRWLSLLDFVVFLLRLIGLLNPAAEQWFLLSYAVISDLVLIVIIVYYLNIINPSVWRCDNGSTRFWPPFVFRFYQFIILPPCQMIRLHLNVVVVCKVTSFIN